MKLFLIIGIFLFIGGMGLYYVKSQPEEEKAQTEPASQSIKTTPPLSPQAETPRVQHPVPAPTVITDSVSEIDDKEMPVEKKTEEPLPTLDDSDPQVKKVLLETFDDNLVNQIFRQTGIIHRFVATIDGLPQKKLADKIRLTRPTSGKFLIQKDASDTITIDPKNFSRYRVYTKLLNALETDQLVTLYTRFYPLIQEAYD